MEYHKLLKKQIKKHLTPDCIDNPLFKNFIEAVNGSYNSFETDKEISNHAFEESEKEYNAINNSLKEAYELKKQSIANLYKSIDVPKEEFEAVQNTEKIDELLFISNYINRQIEQHKMNDLRIQRLASMKHLLIQIASNYINIPYNNIKETKIETLKKLAQFVSADRAYIFDYDHQNETCSNTFEWCGEGIEPQIENLQNIPFEYMTDWVESNKKGEIMSIPKIEDLPEGELKQILSDQDIKSLLVLPIMGKKECLGFVGFDSVKKHYEYTDKEKDLLLFFAKMLANVEDRNNIEIDLKHNIELLKTLLANLQSGILLKDENRKILFTNQMFCDFFCISASPDDLIGIDFTKSADELKQFFVDSENFATRIEEILNEKKIVINEKLELKSGRFLERDYIPMFDKNKYKGHLWKYTDITSRIESQLLLEQSEERNRLIMNSALNAIININNKGRIIFWNSQAEQIFGWKKEEILGKTLQETIIPVQHKEGHVNGMKHYMKTGEGPALNKLLELTAIKKDGTEFPIEIAIIPIKQNDELFFCSFIQDISERKQIENKVRVQEEKFRNIIANMNLGLLEVDINENIQFANQSFIDISGYELDEIIGKNPVDIFVFGENKGIISSKGNLRKNGKSDIYQIPIKNKRGELKWWAISGAPNYDDKGNLIGSIGIHLDITDQKQLEIELEDEKLKALEASKAKEVFLANMSHEIRTPLNAIIGFLRELEKLKPSEIQKKYLKNSTLASKHLLSIINNILDISKIEAGEMALENTDFELDKTIQNVITILEPKATQKGIKINLIYDFSIAKALLGDAVRIEQILFNLIGNALKFTQKGSITIQCELVKEYNNYQEICISIIDTGVGMNSKFIDTIFSKFSQEEIDTTRKFGGTGLGMAITKELIDLMNGKIAIQSEKNKGTIIKINLNLEKGSIKNLVVVKNRAAFVNFEKTKILLVEDNDFNRIVAQNSLKMANCEVVEAENGQEAISILKNNSFDIILMDIQMPIMDGIEATIIIRNELKLNTPIIALTANAFKTEIEKCKSIGMNDTITKPFEENVLLETISKYINTPKPTELEYSKPKLSYNLNNLKTLSRGNEEFVQKMIQIFIKQTNDIIIEAENAIGENNFEEVSRLIHKIKPSIDGMAIDSIKKEVRELELFSKTSNDKEKITEMFSIIKIVLLKVVDEITRNEINK
jgi:PAS domain S-box-containing protein